MITDTNLRNTILSDKMVESLMKTEKITEDEAFVRLEELTPLAQIVPDAKPVPVKKEPVALDVAGGPAQEWQGGDIKPGPIDIEYKTKMKPSLTFKAPSGHEIKTWGRVGSDN